MGGFAGEQVIEDEEIDGVDMIVSGLFEVGAVGFDLERELGFDDFGAALAPRFGFGEAGEESAEGVEGHGFAEQVSIRGKVHGEVFE